ncbi:MAG TPA: R3H domain-containing nucleic acid-binding protein [Anaerolineae bacterium]|nr:R3H domain-containing nucleic acid-binding protein [Anaerolineae bacterium]HQI83102.1 R3H domain-containing nucleic acid-binding protein [Anaerolineae bacterium]
MTKATQLIVDDLDALMHVLPPAIQDVLEKEGRRDDLLEVILDLGRVPTARYTDKELVLLEREVTQEDIDCVVERVGDFDADNRAGIARTLHRISAIRNRKGAVVGLTCRVGRAVFGTIAIIDDLIASGNSVLLLGRPGVGKTTMLREAARVLAETKRVVIVDTSNEIAGDGDIPHPAIGRARRMQVSLPSLQHEVMIEAVENHNPEVIVIDEIGRELEAMAARTIAERGVQLIATAHGNTLENLLLNPTLSDLVGGIESVTLSDEEARRRGTQKSVLERRAPPTFDVLVEIQDRQRVLVRDDVAQAVDALLRGHPRPDVLRYRDDDGEVRMEQLDWAQGDRDDEDERPALAWNPETTKTIVSRRKLKEKRVYPFGVARNRLIRAAQVLHVPVRIVDNLGEAHVLVTSKQYYRKRPSIVVDAERSNIPVFALRANTAAQMESFLTDLFQLSAEETDPYTLALKETESAIQRVLGGEEQAVDLAPQNSFVRRVQHEMAQNANLVSKSHGKEPNRSVRIFRES